MCPSTQDVTMKAIRVYQHECWRKKEESKSSAQVKKQIKEK